MQALLNHLSWSTLLQDMCSKAVGLQTHKLYLKNLCDHVMGTRALTSSMNEIFIWTTKIMRENDYNLTSIMLHHPFHQKMWYIQGVTYLIMSHLEDLCVTWYYQRNRQKIIMTSLEICCPYGLFSSILLVIITLTLHILKNKIKNSDIIKGDSDHNEEVLQYKIWFWSFGWQYQGVL